VEDFIEYFISYISVEKAAATSTGQTFTGLKTIF
jgi:hypothetical protein